MKKLTTVFTLLCIVLSVAVFVAVYQWQGKDIQSESRKVEGSKSVLILSRDTDFKRQVVTALADSLNRDFISVEIKGISAIEDTTNFSNYNVVVLISPCIAGHWEKSVTAILKKSAGNSSYITVTTSGSPVWKPNPTRIPSGVDAISSASLTEKSAELTSAVLNLIRKKI